MKLLIVALNLVKETQFDRTKSQTMNDLCFFKPPTEYTEMFAIFDK